MTVKNLIIPGRYSPQQMLNELNAQVEQIESLAVVIRWKNKQTTQAWSAMSHERAFTCYHIAADRVMSLIRGKEVPKPQSGGAA